MIFKYLNMCLCHRTYCILYRLTRSFRMPMAMGNIYIIIVSYYDLKTNTDTKSICHDKNMCIIVL